MRIVGIAAVLGFSTAALLHMVWLFAPWPLPTWTAWSHAFGGAGFRVPAAIMTCVALLFAAAAYIVGARAMLVRRVGPLWVYRLGCWTIAIVFALRSIIGFVQMRSSLSNPDMPAGFRETIGFYLFIYLPIFFVLGALTAYVEVAAARQARHSNPAH